MLKLCNIKKYILSLKLSVKLFEVEHYDLKSGIIVLSIIIIYIHLQNFTI